jgi:hypothetical protein
MGADLIVSAANNASFLDQQSSSSCRLAIRASNYRVGNSNAKSAKRGCYYRQLAAGNLLSAEKASPNDIATKR